MHGRERPRSIKCFQHQAVERGRVLVTRIWHHGALIAVSNKVAKPDPQRQQPHAEKDAMFSDATRQVSTPKRHSGNQQLNNQLDYQHAHCHCHLFHL